MKAIWEHILDNDADMISKLDYNSVLSLELTCPRLSDSDAQALKNNHIGQSLTEQQQGILMTRVLEIDTLIPSFRSLFDDLNYLELLVNAIKKLRRPRKDELSIRESLRHKSSNKTLQEIAWRKLFLYTIRNYYRIHGPSSTETCLKPSGPLIDLDGQVSSTNAAQLYHFSRYASRSAFTIMTRASLPYPGNERDYDARDRRCPNLSTYEGQAGVRKSRRSGPPRTGSHKTCRAFFWSHSS